MFHRTGLKLLDADQHKAEKPVLWRRVITHFNPDFRRQFGKTDATATWMPIVTQLPYTNYPDESTPRADNKKHCKTKIFIYIFSRLKK
jgi:hypothetical protein